MNGTNKLNILEVTTSKSKGKKFVGAVGAALSPKKIVATAIAKSGRKVKK